MIIFISKIIFLLSILGILFIVIRKIPALSHLPEKSIAERFSFKKNFIWFENFLKQFFSSYFFRVIFIGGLEKSLRKLKIIALKVDNIVDKLIRKLKGKSEKGMPR